MLVGVRALGDLAHVVLVRRVTAMAAVAEGVAVAVGVRGGHDVGGGVGGEVGVVVGVVGLEKERRIELRTG